MGVRGYCNFSKFLYFSRLHFFSSPLQSKKAKQKSYWFVAALYNLLPGGLCSDNSIVQWQLQTFLLVWSLLHFFMSSPTHGTLSLRTIHPTHPPIHPPTHSTSSSFIHLCFFCFSSWANGCMSDNSDSSSSMWVKAKGFRGAVVAGDSGNGERERYPSVWWDHTVCLSIC